MSERLIDERGYWIHPLQPIADDEYPYWQGKGDKFGQFCPTTQMYNEWQAWLRKKRLEELADFSI